jgi:hypothetical protein
LECHKEVAQDLSGKHTVAHMLPANRELIRMKDVNKSFFGQSTNCTPCHSDPHKGQLGNECTKRHNLESRKAAKNSDHSKTPYPLTGLHIKVACEKCHKLQGMKCDTCSACHSDPHRGAFKKSLRQLPYHQRVENDAGGL